MLGFFWWMIVGLVAGALARLLVPGRQPMGMFLTMILGLIGSVVGGFISSLIWGYDPSAPGIHASGMIMSTIGAVLVLALFLKVSRSGSVS